MIESILWDLINKLPKENITNLLFNVLDSMQGYNGQSRAQCIIEELGMESNDDNSYKIPTLKHLKKVTSTVLLDP